MRFHRYTFIPLCFLGAVALPAHAGSVEVSFIEPIHYADAGRHPSEARSTEVTLARFLHGLGERHLAPDQMLKIDVLDIDLAGTVRPSRRGNGDIRIARGGADVPSIKMRYALISGGTVIQSGEETVVDLNYLGHISDFGVTDPLRHEKRMLRDWFKARFVNRKAAAG